MVEVLLDTNAMMLPFNKRFDVYTELKFSIGGAELMTLSSCYNELVKLLPSAAELAKRELRIVKSKGFADDAILEYARKNKVIVCTQDKELRDKLRKAGVRVLMFSNGRLRYI